MHLFLTNKNLQNINNQNIKSYKYFVNYWDNDLNQNLIPYHNTYNLELYLKINLIIHQISILIIPIKIRNFFMRILQLLSINYFNLMKLKNIYSKMVILIIFQIVF